jgi:hypothetical protein
MIHVFESLISTSTIFFVWVISFCLLYFAIFYFLYFLLWPFFYYYAGKKPPTYLRKIIFFFALWTKSSYIIPIWFYTYYPLTPYQSFHKAFFTISEIGLIIFICYVVIKKRKQKKAIKNETY